MVNNKTLRIIVIEDTLNEAENIVSLLKNAGIAVRMQYIEDLEQLKECISPDSYDLLLCTITSFEPTLMQAIDVVNKLDPDMAIIALHEEEDSEFREEALTSGACDLITRSNPTHFQSVIKRELDVVALKRRFRECNDSLMESEKRCHVLLDSSRDAITYVHEGMHIYANQVYLDTFGFASLDDIEGTPIMDMVTENDLQQLKKYLRMYSKGEHKTKALEVMGKKPSGKTFRAQMEFSPASIEGEPCTQIVIRDQSLNKELESKLKFLSNKDVLTGLYNRQYFLDIVTDRLIDAKDDNLSRSLLYIEPDNCKFIKETLGINGVDIVLTDVANIIKDEIDKDSTAARFSDTAFAVLTQINDTNELMALADNIRSAIESHISELEGKSITCTCSIGASQFGPNNSDVHQIISQVDLACELAHNDGGNTVHLHNPIADEKASRQRDIHWSKTIEHALNHNLFSLVYQPIASLHGETSEKYEVLLRMVDEDNNPVPPGKFIPAAEEHGMMVAVDRWVIVHAIKVLRERLLSGKDTVVFIKLSTTSINEPKMLGWISDVINKSKINPKKLVFEVHENAINDVLRQAKEFVEGLKKLKCSFCLEHFGTGKNSIQVLKHLQAEYIKIDGSFMRDLASNQENQAMVKSMTELAQGMKASTIAEFVEDASSLAVLWQCGINYIQGNFLQQPNDIMDYDFEGDED